MFQVDQNLHNLTKILRAEPFNKGLADFFCQKFIEGLIAVSTLALSDARGEEHKQKKETWRDIRSGVIRQSHLNVESGHLRRNRTGWGNFECRYSTGDTFEKMVARKGICYFHQRSMRNISWEGTYVMCSISCSGVYQLTLRTLSNSSCELIAMGM